MENQHGQQGSYSDELTGTAVTVTVLNVTGNDVDCDITGTDATNNAIFLPDGTPTITFNLDPGTSGLSFDTTDPFTNKSGRCPRQGGAPKPPFSLVTSPPPTGTQFAVAVGAISGKSVSYYRLNFNGNKGCDPIIIHE